MTRNPFLAMRLLPPQLLPDRSAKTAQDEVYHPVNRKTPRTTSTAPATRRQPSRSIPLGKTYTSRSTKSGAVPRRDNEGRRGDHGRRDVDGRAEERPAQAEAELADDRHHAEARRRHEGVDEMAWA